MVRSMDRPLCRPADGRGGTGRPGVRDLRGLLITLVVLAGAATACADEGPAFVPGGSAGNAAPAAGGTPSAPSDVSATSGIATPTPSDSATPDGAPATPGGGDGPRTETVDAGPGLKVRVEWPGGLDPEHAAMLTSYRDAYAGWLKSIATGGETADYRHAMEMESALKTYRWVNDGFLARNRSLRGTAKLYAMRVRNVNGNGAEAGVCVDERGLEVTDARTGQDLADQPAFYRTQKGVYYHTAVMHRGDDGKWRVRLLLHSEQPEERAKGCLR